MVEKRHALGRGLDALIGDALEGTGRTPGAAFEVDIDRLTPNSYQPRSRTEDARIDELAQSIRSNGVIQPILVRPSGHGYQIIAGERRWHASQRAGLLKVPVTVRDVPEGQDLKLLEWALIENIQREDLNPIEEARAYQALIEKVGLTHDQLSERVGRQRSSITNALRLLSLPVEVMDMVSRGTFSAGHARAVLSLDNAADQLGAARYVSAKGFSVRRTEAYVRRRLRKAHSRPKARRVEELREWEVKLQQRFGTHVAITAGRKGGKVEFEYFSQEDLERLFEVWGVL
jgi:ParB family chromosome partitioning protein